MTDRVAHQEVDGVWLSPAEVMSLVIRLLAHRAGTGRWPEQLPLSYLDGPDKPPHVEANNSALALEDLFGTCLYERAAMEVKQRLPNEVQVGRTWLSPATFLATVGQALPAWLRGQDSDALIVEGRLGSADYVADHVSWGWTVFPPGFDGDALLGLANLQAWTLKPALLGS
jgi:hypothetical protein